MKINYLLFKQALKAASYMTSKDDCRPVLRKIMVTITDGKIFIDALDGYMGVRITLSGVETDISTKFLISLEELAMLPQSKADWMNDTEILEDKILWVKTPFRVEQEIPKENFEFIDITKVFPEKKDKSTPKTALQIRNLDKVIKSAKAFSSSSSQPYFKIYMPETELQPVTFEYKPSDKILCEYIVLPIRTNGGDLNA